MKKLMFITFLAVILAACAPATTPAPTEISIPTFTPVPPTFTPTVVAIMPTPLPTQPPFPMITPDAIQVERWREIEKELAKNILPTFPIDSVICEWDILGRSEQKVYVYAICASVAGSDRFPVVIHFRADGTIQNVEIPGRALEWFPDINRMFPLEIQEKFSFYSAFSIRYTEILNHLRYRFDHPEEPPLIVLSATSTSTP